jgi:hypothetical protein
VVASDTETGQSREVKTKPTAADTLHGRTRPVARRAPGVGTHAFSWRSRRITKRWSRVICSCGISRAAEKNWSVVLVSRTIGHEKKKTDTWAREEETRTGRCGREREELIEKENLGRCSPWVRQSSKRIDSGGNTITRPDSRDKTKIRTSTE